MTEFEPRHEPPFAEGDRIKLIHMPHDPNPVKPGTKGTVKRLLWAIDRWQIVVTWDNGRTLNLVVPPDVAEKI
jgi:hypothetical protein